MGLFFSFIGCSQPSEESSENNEVSITELNVENSTETENQSQKSTSSVVASPFSSNNEKWAKGRILVQPLAGVSDQKLASILSAHGGKTISKITAINVHIVELPANVNEKAIAALLANHPQLKFAEVDGIASSDQLTNDTYYPNQWHLPIINAPAAWDNSTGSGVIIAILDSGIDSTHPDLAARIIPGYNFVENNTDTTDLWGHGTKCAGVAAAIGNNAEGTAGVAWNSQILPVRISDSTGYTYWSNMAAGLNWAADHGARGASISFNGINGSSTVLSAAQYFRSKGGVVVCSAGNTGGSQAYAPSDYLINVSATDSGDALASWSSFGQYVDVSAPGVGIWTTSMGGGYSAPSGTSFSCPMTAGIVALMFSAKPSLTPTQIQSLLFSTAKDLGDAGWDQYFGHGRVDAAAAVLAAKNAVVTDTQAPSVSITSPQNGAVLKGIAIIDITANDNIGVSRVDLYLGGTLVASDTLSPYSFSVDTLSRTDGAYNLVAQAYDATGNMGSSNPVSITIDNVVDTIAPIVTISNPVDGSTVKSGNVNISASATDNEGVKSMTLIIDGVTKATSTSGSISYTWNTRKVAAGTHTIQVNAVDATGNVGTKIIQVKK